MCTVTKVHVIQPSKFLLNAGWSTANLPLQGISFRVIAVVVLSPYQPQKKWRIQRPSKKQQFTSPQRQLSNPAPLLASTLQFLSLYTAVSARCLSMCNYCPPVVKTTHCLHSHNAMWNTWLNTGFFMRAKTFFHFNGLKKNTPKKTMFPA